MVFWRGFHFSSISISLLKPLSSLPSPLFFHPSTIYFNHNILPFISSSFLFLHIFGGFYGHKHLKFYDLMPKEAFCLNLTARDDKTPSSTLFFLFLFCFSGKTNCNHQCWCSRTLRSCFSFSKILFANFKLLMMLKIYVMMENDDGRRDGNGEGLMGEEEKGNSCLLFTTKPIMQILMIIKNYWN